MVLVRIYSTTYVALLSLLCCNVLFAQSPPTDLTELDLEEILALHIIRQSSVVEEVDKWSIGYSFLVAKFDENRQGTNDLSTNEVLWNGVLEDRTENNFPIVPKTISQQAHLFEIAYDITEQWSLSLLVPYILQSTDHVSIVKKEVDGVEYDFSQFTIESSGVGDALLSISHPVWRQGQHFIMSVIALSVPIGSIDEIGPTPREPGKDTQLPFTMQIGSGTYDLSPSLAYAGNNEKFSWSTHLRGVFRLNTNDRDYSLGNRLLLSGVLKMKPTNWLEPSFGMIFQSWGQINGEDEDLKVPKPPGFPYPAAVTDPRKFGGKKINVELSLTLKKPESLLENHSVEIRGGRPVYQDLNGPQPKEIWRFGLNWNLHF